MAIGFASHAFGFLLIHRQPPAARVYVVAQPPMRKCVRINPEEKRAINVLLLVVQQIACGGVAVVPAAGGGISRGWRLVREGYGNAGMRQSADPAAGMNGGGASLPP